MPCFDFHHDLCIIKGQYARVCWLTGLPPPRRLSSREQDIDLHRMIMVIVIDKAVKQPEEMLCGTSDRTELRRRA
jgi:hypothetical protein